MARAEAAKRRAEERLAQRRRPIIDFERARIALMKSLVRLQVSTSPHARVNLPGSRSWQATDLQCWKISSNFPDTAGSSRASWPES